MCARGCCRAQGVAAGGGRPGRAQTDPPKRVVMAGSVSDRGGERAFDGGFCAVQKRGRDGRRGVLFETGPAGGWSEGGSIRK